MCSIFDLKSFPGTHNVKHLSRFLKSKYGAAAYLIKKIRQTEEADCRIEKINANEGEVFIHYRGVSPIVKQTFHEAIEDKNIVDKLSPTHASWLGYYYGRYSKKNIMSPPTKSKNAFGKFELTNNKNKYTITMLDRMGNLIYQEIKTGKVLKKTPLEIFQDSNLITDFDQSQACYIGIQAGIYVLKKQDMNDRAKYSCHPLLRLIK